MEFEAIEKDGVINVKAIIEDKPDGSKIVHVPSMSLINKLTKEFKDGKRDIQPIESKFNE